MKRQRFIGAASIVAVLAAVGVVVVSALDRPEAEAIAATSAVETADQSAPGSASLRAFLNPESGELEVGPAPASDVELDADMQNALRRDDEGLVQVHHANGSVSMDLQGRFQSVSIVRKNPDGTVTICSDNAEGAQNALDGKTSTPVTPEVK